MAEMFFAIKISRTEILHYIFSLKICMLFAVYVFLSLDIKNTKHLLKNKQHICSLYNSNLPQLRGCS